MFAVWMGLQLSSALNEAIELITLINIADYVKKNAMCNFNEQLYIKI